MEVMGDPEANVVVTAVAGVAEVVAAVAMVELVD